MDLTETCHCARRLALVGGALRAGILDAAEERSTADEVAREVGGDPRAVGIVLDALKSLGLVSEDGDRYRVSGEGSQLLHGGGLRYTTLHGLEVLESWLTLPDVIATGGPVESEERYDGGWEVFIGAMGEKDPEYVEAVVSTCIEEHPGAGSVLDVGGGPGTISLEFVDRGLSATMLDREPVVEMMRPEFEGEVELVAGDFTEGLPPGPFDIAYLGNVCHIYGPDTNVELFRRVESSLAPGGVVAVNDFVRGISPRAELFAVNMLVNTEEGGTWTMEQYSSWLEEAGFEHAHLRDFDESQLVFARKP